MEHALLGLEDSPADQSLLEAIFRGAHTIKGNAAGLGYAEVSEFAHAFEDLLQDFRAKLTPITEKSITLLLRSVDALRQMIPQAIGGATELAEEHRTLMAQLRSQLASPNAAQSVTVRDQHNNEVSGERAQEPHVKIERPQTVRVDVRRLDRLLNLTSEITVAHSRLRQAIASPLRQITDISEAQTQLERLSLNLQEQIMKVRMVPLGPIFRQYDRVVRDLAQQSDKNARLAISGDDVEIDLSMVEQLKDPLTHMVRNAFDHGLESPEIRRSRGKNPCGVITLKALHDGASLVIQLTDDGAGLDRHRIAARVRSLGLAAEPERLSDEKLFNFIFEPGFSTAEKVSDLSGRGVGMDVVRRNIDALRGTIGLESHPGKGTTIAIRLPLTLVITEGFAVGIGNETYVLPFQAVLECIELPEQARCRDVARGVINLRGEPLPYVRLRNWFGPADGHLNREHVVVVETDNGKAGLVVDALHGVRQTVIKPLDKRFHGLPLLAGSTILASGRVALILDVQALIRDVIDKELTHER